MGLISLSVSVLRDLVVFIVKLILMSVREVYVRMVEFVLIVLMNFSVIVVLVL